MLNSDNEGFLFVLFVWGALIHQFLERESETRETGGNWREGTEAIHSSAHY